MKPVDGRAAFRPAVLHAGSRRERNGVLRIRRIRLVQDYVIVTRMGCESDRSDGQRISVCQQWAHRSGVVSVGNPYRDLSLTAVPPGGRFFIVVRAGVNALWRSVGAAANRFTSADSTE